LQQVLNSRARARFHRQVDCGIRLFCLPHAGGAASNFRDWFKSLDAHADVVAVEYPGRGARRGEAPLNRVTDIVNALVPDIVAQIDRPFALFGHSMGCLVAYELLRALGAHGVQPVCAFMAGCRPPSIKRSRKNLHELPDGEFVEELRRLKGTPEELLADAEFMSLAMPILRADFEAVATYPQSEAALSCPIFAYGGIDDDNLTIEQLGRWREMTRAQCTVRVFSGGHFFLHHDEPAFLRTLLADLISCT
jgi:medium-chain acyl-[acyl-carrier-protein] hydrolase